MIKNRLHITAKEILENPAFLAMCYGGYRSNSRKIQPTVNQIKEDLKILFAMGIKVIRTYNVHLPEAENILHAISELNHENSNFEMYVMLGAWIDCKNAWTNLEPNHFEESEKNITEIERAVELANKFPEIVKIIAVGNEAMVKWATSYYVQPNIILKWVNYLQDLKTQNILPKQIWITSSDNFVSWGGGSEDYHTSDLYQLISAVDYISLHTYPMHDTHYNPIFWGVNGFETELPKTEQIKKSIERSVKYAQSQFQSVKTYMQNLGFQKPIHIGETGWASKSNELYGEQDSKAVDEFKAGLFYKMMREWTNKNHISCFYFEAFDEPWKDSENPYGSENHFGLFTVEGKAKYALWNLVDQNLFQNLKRDGNIIKKTYDGNLEKLLDDVFIPPLKTLEAF